MATYGSSAAEWRRESLASRCEVRRNVLSGGAFRLAEEVKLIAAGTGGVFGEGEGGVGGGRGGVGLFGPGGPFPEAAAVGVAVGGLGVFFGLADAGGVFGALGGFGGSRLFNRVTFSTIRFGRALRRSSRCQAADNSERCNAHNRLLT